MGKIKVCIRDLKHNNTGGIDAYVIWQAEMYDTFVGVVCFSDYISQLGKFIKSLSSV